MAKRSHKKEYLIDLAIVVVVAIIIGVSMAFAGRVELAFGLAYYEEVPIEIEEPEEGEEGDAVEIDEAAELKVHFVDVGQGDCAIIELPYGETMLIDGGENNKTVEAAIDKFIADTLPEDFKYFDYCVLTHPDSDHCGSLDYVLGKYPARVCYRPNVEAVGTEKNPYVDPAKGNGLTADAVTKNTAVYANAIAPMYAANDDFTPTVYITDPTVEGQTITGGKNGNTFTLNFYTPLSTKYTGEGDWNNYSPIMVLEYNGFKFAMSGDAEEKNLGEFVTKVNNAPTDGVTDKYDAFDSSYCVNVVKAGHHGSRNATTSEYLEAITSPSGVGSTYCVISCGEGNSYKHPHQEALDRYIEAGFKEENILRTDVAGDISFSVRQTKSGEFALFYGSKQSRPTRQELRYKKVGYVELRWKWFGWCVLAFVVILALVHILILRLATENNGGGNGTSSGSNKGNGGKTSQSSSKSNQSKSNGKKK